MGIDKMKTNYENFLNSSKQPEQEQVDKRIIKLSQYLSDAINSSNKYITSTSNKTLLEYDLESFRVHSFFKIKSWFKTKIVIVYYEKQGFYIEEVIRTWFKTTTNYYSGLSWTEYKQLLKEIL